MSTKPYSWPIYRGRMPSYIILPIISLCSALSLKQFNLVSSLWLKDLHSSGSPLTPLHSHRVLFLSLLLFVGLAGCGPASSDNASNPGSHASMGGQSLAKQGSSSHNDPLTTAVSSVPLALDEMGSASSASPKVIAPERVSLNMTTIPSSKPTDPTDVLVVPPWMAKELDSPDVSARIRALETWAKSAAPGAVDPLILAYKDKDERVRARAMELIEQDWSRAADTGK
jgi:hypothetical protein